MASEEGDLPMKLQIDFYSKTEVAFDIDHTSTDGQPAFPDVQANDLFLFAAYILRQLSNLGDHLVGKCLDGFLVSKSSLQTQLDKAHQISDAGTLLDYREHHVLQEVIKNTSNDPTSTLATIRAFKAERNSINPNFIQAMDDIISTGPKIVHHRGRRGKKSFVLTTEPRFRVDLHGIGIFSLDTNHYVFHSVICLARYTMKRYRSRPEFLDKIHRVGTLCADLHFAKKIGPQQEALAVMVLMGAEVLKRDQ
jgi:hypothetical protein